MFQEDTLTLFLTLRNESSLTAVGVSASVWLLRRWSAMGPARPVASKRLPAFVRTGLLCMP